MKRFWGSSEITGFYSEKFMLLGFSLRYLSYTTSIMTVKEYGGIVRYVLENEVMISRKEKK